MEETIPLEPGKYYHIYNRGNNREDLFREERNYFYFLQLWGKHIEPVAESYAYCLLKNHFHFLVRIREEPLVPQNLTGLKDLLGLSKDAQVRDVQNLTGLKDLLGFQDTQVYNDKFISKQFSNFFNAYTKAVNKMYQRSGKLFHLPFKRKPVTDEAYFTQLIQYIHFNPQKHGFVEDFRNWLHSSYESHLSEKPTRLMREQVLHWFGGVEEYLSFHQYSGMALEEWDG